MQENAIPTASLIYKVETTAAVRRADAKGFVRESELSADELSQGENSRQADVLQETPGL